MGSVDSITLGQLADMLVCAELGAGLDEPWLLVWTDGGDGGGGGGGDSELEPAAGGGGAEADGCLQKRS